MTLDPKKAGDDLAFMRSLIEDDGSDSRKFGIIYMFAGILYGLQCIANSVLLNAEISVPTWVWMAVGWLPTLLFLIVLFCFVWRDRAQPFGNGTTKRAVNAAFAGVGIANLVLAIVFGWAAYQKADWSIWLLFPVVVCALQGAGWFTVAILRRHIWQGLTAIGWFISAGILGFLVSQTQAYILVLGLALFICMGLPGFIMLRASKQKTAKG